MEDGHLYAERKHFHTEFNISIIHRDINVTMFLSHTKYSKISLEIKWAFSTIQS